MSKKVYIITFDFSIGKYTKDLVDLDLTQIEISSTNDKGLVEKIANSRAEKIFIDGSLPNRDRLFNFMENAVKASHTFNFPLALFSFNQPVIFPGVTHIGDNEELKKMLANQPVTT